MDKMKDKELIKTILFYKLNYIQFLAYNQGKYHEDEELDCINQLAIDKLKQEIYQLLTEN